MKSRYLILSTLFVLINSLPAKTINIPSDYNTIQQGIDNSINGDTVLVSPGTYYENINFDSKNIILSSLFITTGDTSFISQTVIDGNRQGTVVTFESGEDSTTVLSGFTITNGYLEGPNLTDVAAGIISNNGSGPILDHLNIHGNEAGGMDLEFSNGVFCGNKSYPKLFNVVIKNNKDFKGANGAGGGILCRDSSNVEMRNCLIKNNDSSDGGGISCSDSYLELYDCTIVDNHGTPGGGLLGRNSIIHLYRSSIENNRSHEGGGLYFWGSEAYLNDVDIKKNLTTGIGGGKGAGLYAIESELFFDNCKISKNRAEKGFDSPYGGGIYLGRETGATIKHSTIEENTSEGEGGGISCRGPVSLTLRDVVIQRNFALQGGGGISLWQSHLNLMGATIRQNVTHSRGGGIYYQNTSTISSNIEQLSSIYMNKAPAGGSDLNTFKRHPLIDVVLDTFTINNPTEYQAFPIENINITFNHALIEPQKADLYVSPTGSDLNTGLSPSQALQTINRALFTVDADSLNPINVYIAPGLYSRTETNEDFPLFVPGYVSLVGENMENTILDGEAERSIIRLFEAKNANIKNMTIENGYALKGGGIYSAAGRSLLFDHLIVRNNTAKDLGAGAYITGGYREMTIPDSIYDNIVFKNVLFVSNKTLANSDARGSGGINVAYSDLQLISTTLINNFSAPLSELDYAGGIVANRLANLFIINSIVTSNNPHNIKMSQSARLHFINSNIEGGVNGIIDGTDNTVVWLSGNIDADPVFVGGEPFDYRLSKHSPCIDAGTAFFEWEGDTLLNLSADEYLGSAPDMGAFEFDPATGIKLNINTPTDFKLEQNYPNPFNPKTTISYNLPKNCHVQLAIFDVLGRNVVELANANQKAGEHKIVWDGKGKDGLNLTSGVYFYKFKGGGYEKVKKLLLVR